VSILTVVKLRHDLSGSIGVNHESLLLADRQLVAFHNWTFLLGPSFCAAIGNGIILGTIMYRSALVPRRLALLGVIGGPLLFVGATLALFDVYNPNSTGQGVLTVGEFLWELLLGIYLIVRGFRSAGLASLGLPEMGDGPKAALT
jgi:hypothetical protein